MGKEAQEYKKYLTKRNKLIKTVERNPRIKNYESLMKFYEKHYQFRLAAHYRNEAEKLRYKDKLSEHNRNTLVTYPRKEKLPLKFNPEEHKNIYGKYIGLSVYKPENLPQYEACIDDPGAGREVIAYPIASASLLVREIDNQIRNDPQNPDLYYELGCMLLEAIHYDMPLDGLATKDQQYKAVLQYFDKAIFLTEKPAYIKAKADIYLKLKNYKLAADLYQQVLKKCPYDFEVRERLKHAKKEMHSENNNNYYQPSDNDSENITHSRTTMRNELSVKNDAQNPLVLPKLPAPDKNSIRAKPDTSSKLKNKLTIFKTNHPQTTNTAKISHKSYSKPIFISETNSVHSNNFIFNIFSGIVSGTTDIFRKMRDYYSLNVGSAILKQAEANRINTANDIAVGIEGGLISAAFLGASIKSWFDSSKNEEAKCEEQYEEVCERNKYATIYVHCGDKLEGDTKKEERENMQQFKITNPKEFNLLLELNTIPKKKRDQALKDLNSDWQNYILYYAKVAGNISKSNDKQRSVYKSANNPHNFVNNSKSYNAEHGGRTFSNRR